MHIYLHGHSFSYSFLGYSDFILIGIFTPFGHHFSEILVEMGILIYKLDTGVISLDVQFLDTAK